MSKWKSTVTLQEPEEITSLPWAGNFGDDQPIAKLCDDFILDLARRGEYEKWKQAQILVNLHCCGERLLDSEEGFRQYYEQTREERRWERKGEGE